MSEEFGNKIFDSFYNFLDYMQYFFEDDISLAATDRDTFIIQKCNSNIPMKASIGDKIPQGGAIREAITTGKVIVKDVPKEIYGVPFTSYAIPVKDDNSEVVGCLVLGKSMVRKNEVNNEIHVVSSALEQISIAINNISIGIQQVVDMNTSVIAKVQESYDGAKNTNEILNFIKGISKKTNMLGLNAAIESSKAGEAGKGFSVVAAEIRKLSSSTNESINNIGSTLDKVKLSIADINEIVVKANEVFTDEAAAIQEIAAAIEELNSSTNFLQELAKKI